MPNANVSHFIRRHLFGTLTFCLVAIGAIFTACNVEPEVEYRVDLKLADSLSKDKGRYDSLEISFAHPNGEVFSPIVFKGPYNFDSSGGVLKDLLIGNNAPTEYVVVIKAYKGGKNAVYQITVKNGKSDSLIIVVALPPITGPAVPPESTKTNVPSALVLSDSILNLGVTSSPRQVFATLEPVGVTGLVQFVSTHPAFATVDESGFITPVAVGETQIIASVIGHDSIADTLLVKVIVPPAISAVSFARPAPLLYTGAPGIKLNVSHQPSNLSGAFEFKSSDDGIITVTSDGTVAAKSEGSAIITVSALGSTSVTDTLTIRALRDAPYIDAGTTQSVAVGQPVTIKVKVTQAFGTLNLSWDFNGDGQPEGQTTQDTATATHTYATQGDYSAEFTAKDGEGNTTTQSIRVRVGKAGPLVIITSPKQDTLVNSPNFTVSYTSDGTPKAQAFTLLEGITTLTVKDSNATGKDSASVKVTLDTKAPVVKITAPANGFVTNLPEIDVAWTVDSVAQNTGRKENLVGKQGAISIIREFTDAAGNRGRDSISITRDTVPPSTPVFAGGDTTTNVKRPIWTWTSGGGGNGTFAVQLGTAAAEEVTTARYQPLAELKDSSYTLRVRERDAAGNWSAWASKTIAIKSSSPGAPRINHTLTTPSPTNNKRPTWAWVTSGLNGASGFFRWSVTTPTPLSDSGTATSFTPAVDLPDGTYTLTLQERDGLGNWSNSVTCEIRILTQGALVEITAPARGSYTNVKSGVIAVAWSINGTPQTTTGTSHTLTNEGAWNQIRREFRDVAGNVSFDTMSVFWDTTAPRVAITSPAAGVYVNVLSVPVMWTVDGTKQLTDTIETLTGTDGPKTITRSVTDRAGNSGSASVQINLDRVTPGAPIITASPTSPARTTATSTHAWTWSGTGTSYEWRLSTTNSQTGSGTSIAATTYSRTGLLADGAHYFQVRQINAAGTWSSWATAPLVIDNSVPGAPTVTRNAATTNQPSWSWTANATNAGDGQFRYRWSGATTYLATGVTATSYAPTNLTDGSYNLCVSERDAVDYGAEDCESILVDKTPPEVVITSPANGVYVNTTTITVNWTVDGAPQSNTATLTGGDGPKTITRTGTDAAGNPGSASITVNLDTQLPSSPTAINTNTPTSATSATFTWLSGGGMGTYQVKLNSNDFATGATTVGSATHTVSSLTAGTHTLYVRERDVAGNWSLPGSGTVLVDLAAPTITNPGAQSSTTTSHNLSFNVSDGTGSGVAGATCSWGTSSTVNASNSGGTWTCNITGLNSKTTNVTLTATDRVGRTSSPTTVTITLNLPITPITVDAKYQNYPISGSEITVPYIEGTSPGTPRTQTFTSLGAGNNARTIQGPPNAIGERASVNINIVGLPNVIFVRSTGPTNGDGTSWDNAYRQIGSAVSEAEAKETFNQIWVASGNYSSEEIRPGKSITYYGGFSATGYPISTANRNKSNTIIREIFQFSSESTAFDGFTMGYAYIQNGTLNLTDCAITAAGANGSGLTAYIDGKLNAQNISIVNQSFSFPPMVTAMANGEIVLSGGAITGNTFPTSSGLAAIYFLSGSIRLTGGISVYGNTPMDGHDGRRLQIYGTGELTIDSGTNINCNEVYGEFGSCKGVSF